MRVDEREHEEVQEDAHSAEGGVPSAVLRADQDVGGGRLVCAAVAVVHCPGGGVARYPHFGAAGMNRASFSP